MKSLLEEQSRNECPEFADIEIVISKIRLHVSYRLVCIIDYNQWFVYNLQLYLRFFFL